MLESFFFNFCEIMGRSVKEKFEKFWRSNVETYLTNVLNILVEIL